MTAHDVPSLQGEEVSIFHDQRVDWSGAFLQASRSLRQFMLGFLTLVLLSRTSKQRMGPKLGLRDVSNHLI